MLLAVVGQAYLREDVVAEAPPAPAAVESITLSARPETDARGAALPASEAPSAAGARPEAVSPEARGAEPLGVASNDGSLHPARTQHRGAPE